MADKRPEQLGREEVYVALKGSGTLEADGERFSLDSEHLARVGPDVKARSPLAPRASAC